MSYKKNKVKKIRIQEEREKYPRASLRNVRIAPRKLRVLADMIRGKKVEEAVQLLAFTPRVGAAPLSKLIISAASNAETWKDLDRETLYIHKIYVDEGPTMKWRRSRARGRAFRINKRTSHVTVLVSDTNK